MDKYVETLDALMKAKKEKKKRKLLVPHGACRIDLRYQV